MESSNISSLGEKSPIIWQSHFTLVLLQVVFYVKARLCRSQYCNSITIVTYVSTVIILGITTPNLDTT